MAFDTFLEFTKPAFFLPTTGQIKVVGESGDASHKATVPVLSFAFDVENGAATIASTTSGAGAGKAKLGALQVSKTIDSASPSLFSAVGSGARFPEAVLYIRKSGGAAADYLVYRFSTVYVSKVEWHGSNGDDLPQETVELVYGAMEVNYVQAAATGQGSSKPVTAVWSQISNSADYSVPTS